jgi:hypothetical protein
LGHRSYLAKRNFDEKKEVYYHFLEALGELNANNNSKEFRFRCNVLIAKIELIGSPKVINLCRKFKEQTPSDSERDLTLKELILDSETFMQPCRG